jgi:hypothetical protein
MTKTAIGFLCMLSFLVAAQEQPQPQETPTDNSSQEQVSKDEAPSFYQPIVKQIEGWTVKVDPALLTDENRDQGQRVLQALANHLQRVTFILSAEKVEQLRELPIWIEHSGQGRGLVYHPNPKWLEQNGFNPAMAKHVHVPRPEHLLSSRQWAKHPYAIMHELAHAYHDQVLGFDDGQIKDAFEQAKKLKIYDQVLAHNHATVEHYALSNHKEYFAESTEAYLGVNDFYPFVRAELKVHDPRMFELQQKIWGKIE